jgi:DNA-binding transcriptional LysR family regulator
MIELRHLRYAVAVADEGHITRAAERLGLQQPPLSQQIRALEERLGVALFRRLPRGVAPTAAGEVFIERARAILGDVDLAIEAARRPGRGQAGRLAVGFTGSAAFHPLVASVIRAMRDDSPDLGLTLQEANSDTLIAAVRTGRLDAAFVRAPPEEDAGVTMRQLLDEEMVAILPNDHPLLAQYEEGQAMPLEALSAARFVLYHRPGGPGLYDGIIAACRKAGFSPRVVQEASQMTSTLSLVAAGLGVSLVPGSMGGLGMTGFSQRRLRHGDAPVAPLILAWRTGEESGPLARLIEDVRRALAV